MDTLIITKNELISLLQENQFEHLSQSEQDRLRDYLDNILNTLQEAADPQLIRQAKQKRRRYQRIY